MTNIETNFIVPFEKIKSGFQLLESDEFIYEYLIELGKQITPVNNDFKTFENKVSGCQSNVWIFKTPDGIFHADSDSVMVKGILHIVLSIIESPDFKSSKTPIDTEEYIEKKMQSIGLLDILSSYRKTGIKSSIQKIQSLL